MQNNLLILILLIVDSISLSACGDGSGSPLSGDYKPASVTCSNNAGLQLDYSTYFNSIKDIQTISIGSDTITVTTKYSDSCTKTKKDKIANIGNSQISITYGPVECSSTCLASDCVATSGEGLTFVADYSLNNGILILAKAAPDHVYTASNACGDANAIVSYAYKKI